LRSTLVAEFARRGLEFRRFPEFSRISEEEEPEPATQAAIPHQSHNKHSPDQAGLRSLQVLGADAAHPPDGCFFLRCCASYAVSQRSSNATAERKS
jgi:hypothetical protein